MRWEPAVPTVESFCLPVTQTRADALVRESTSAASPTITTAPDPLGDVLESGERPTGRESIFTAHAAFGPHPAVSRPSASREVAVPRMDDGELRFYIVGQLEKIITDQRAGHLQRAYRLCCALLTDVAAWDYDLRPLLLRGSLNLALYSLLNGDHDMFALLDEHELSFDRRNHFLFQAYLNINRQDHEVLTDYYDLEIGPHVDHDELAEEDVPCHVRAFLRILCATQDTAFISYMCQSRRVAAQCALLVGETALAQSLLRVETIERRPSYDDDDSVVTPA